MKITVMGLGYIGLPTAITLAEAGFEVCGFDVNKKTIETLQGGHIHIVEPGCRKHLKRLLHTVICIFPKSLASPMYFIFRCRRRSSRTRTAATRPICAL